MDGAGGFTNGCRKRNNGASRASGYSSTEYHLNKAPELTAYVSLALVSLHNPVKKTLNFTCCFYPHVCCIPFSEEQVRFFGSVKAERAAHTIT